MYKVTPTIISGSRFLTQICLLQSLSTDKNMTEISTVIERETDVMSITQGRGRYVGNVKAPRGPSLNDVIQKAEYEM